MLAGKYEFNTDSRELIEINTGKLNLKRKDDDDWVFLKEGMEFDVPPNSSFQIEVLELVNYTCSYFDG